MEEGKINDKKFNIGLLLFMIVGLGLIFVFQSPKNEVNDEGSFIKTGIIANIKEKTRGLPPAEETNALLKIVSDYNYKVAVGMNFKDYQEEYKKIGTPVLKFKDKYPDFVGNEYLKEIMGTCLDTQHLFLYGLDHKGIKKDDQLFKQLVEKYPKLNDAGRSYGNGDAVVRSELLDTVIGSAYEKNKESIQNVIDLYK